MNKPVLIVDDSPSFRALVRMALSRAGHSVVEAVDGIDAIEKVVDAEFACIVCDVNMPRLDGVGFVQHLKTTSQRATPVVMLTTSTQDSQKAACKAAGVKVWVTKPFQPSDLVRAVASVCGAPSAGSI